MSWPAPALCWDGWRRFWSSIPSREPVLLFMNASKMSCALCSPSWAEESASLAEAHGLPFDREVQYDREESIVGTLPVDVGGVFFHGLDGTIRSSLEGPL
jgi:hypothetical protein